MLVQYLLSFEKKNKRRYVLVYDDEHLEMIQELVNLDGSKLYKLSEKQSTKIDLLNVLKVESRSLLRELCLTSEFSEYFTKIDELVFKTVEQTSLV